MRRDVVTRSRRAGGLLAVAVLLAAGCTSTPAPVEPSTTAPVATTAAPDLTFDDVASALTPALVPAGEVRPCTEYVPGSPQAQEYLDQAAAQAATGDEAAAAPTPTLPSCGAADVEAVRAASITGFAEGPGEQVVLPTPGGAARVVEVYELADAEAAATTYARHVADPEGWAVDQEIPAAQLEGGLYQARRVVSGARVVGVDVLTGWTASVLSRDEAAFASDGTPSSPPVSYGYLWAVRGPLLVRVQVAGDAPGAAAASATATAGQLVAALAGTAG